MRRSRTPILALFFTTLVSCGTPGVRTAPLGDPDVITRAEIEASQASTAFDIVQSLRSQWLITRGIVNLAQAAGREDIVVYMDNARLGDPGSMRRIPLASVQYLRFFDAREATLRWGGGHLHGAILISTQIR